MARDITVGELLELLSDDETIEGGYDRDGMVALLLLSRAAIEVQARELAELRALLEGRCRLGGVWDDDGPEPERCCLLDADGTGIAEVDAGDFVAEVLRRQVAAQCRQGDEPELGALLALVPGKSDGTPLDLLVLGDAIEVEAIWEIAAKAAASGRGPSREAAIRAATLKLLGLPPGSSCRTCEHWERDAEPVSQAGARPCALDGCPRHPAARCSDGYQPIGVGVVQSGNVIRAGGGS
jgi:hypothetical protein